jgi:quercetin dioxygenase-like cupin family protein
VIYMNFTEVEPIQVGAVKYQGESRKAEGVTVRWLTHRDLGGEEYQHNHALRHFTIAPGGELPIHSHQYTQIMYLLSGRALCLGLSPDGKPEQQEVGPGDFVYTYSFEPHGLKNPSPTEPVVLLCCIDCVDGKDNCLPAR